jgi:molybdopterin-biosynthesis enzyme MoeA-like protein
VMRGMMDDVVPRLRTGAVVIAKTVRVEGAGEGVIAEPLANLAKARPELSIGSYPFFGPQGYGSNLVVRGRDGELVEQTVEDLIEALADIGAKSISRVEA